MDPLSIALGLGSSLGGLLQGRKKEKGVQKQGLENMGFLQNFLGPALQQYIASIYGANALQGAKVGQGLQAQIGNVGAGQSGAGAIGKAIGRASGGTQASIAAGQAKYQGQSDIAGKAIGWATGSGPAQPAGPTPFQTFLTNIGQYMLTRGQAAGMGGQAQGAGGAMAPNISGIQMTPGMAFPGGGNWAAFANPNFKGARK